MPGLVGMGVNEVVLAFAGPIDVTMPTCDPRPPTVLGTVGLIASAVVYLKLRIKLNAPSQCYQRSGAFPGKLLS